MRVAAPLCLIFEHVHIYTPTHTTPPVHNPERRGDSLALHPRQAGELVVEAVADHGEEPLERQLHRSPLPGEGVEGDLGIY